MTTTVLQPTPANIMRCASKLRMGEPVAFPTETVYALGAIATDPKAVERVYDVKGRGRDKPMIVAVAKKADIAKVAKNIPEKAKILIDKFMPGALTLVLDKNDRIPDIVTAGSGSVAVRIPDSDIAKKLIELSGRPVIVPSANTSEKPSPTLASHVKDDLDGKIEYILDGGASKIGIESTIIDVRTEPPTILRVGGVSAEMIQAEIGAVEIRRESANASSYSPEAEVMFSAYYDDMARNICSRYDHVTSRGSKAVIICLDGNKEKYGKRNVYCAGATYTDYAHNLFALLRKADAQHYSAVIAEGVKPEGIGLSLINKLIKISGGLII